MAFNKFREKAINTSNLSELMNGRNKVSIDELMQAFPNGFTLTDFDIVDYTTKDKDGNEKRRTYPVFIIKEDPNICFFGGVVLMNMVDSWLEDYDSIDSCREDFRASGGVEIELYTGRTKGGNNITKVEIL